MDMQATVHASKVRQIVIAAVVAFCAVVLPQAADVVGNGFQSSDLVDAQALLGAGVAAALRAVILYIP
jgi:hypothetical protein